MDPYQPDQWHDFFIATAGAAASLAGLLFVAISLHIRYVATETVYRDMARGSLIGLMIALVLSLLVLIHQPGRWLAVESGGAGVAYLVVVGGQQALSRRRKGRPVPRASLLRSLAAYLMAAIGLAAAIGILFGTGPGLYVQAAIVVVIILWSVWNAWVLVIGVADEEIEADQKAG